MQYSMLEAQSSQPSVFDYTNQPSVALSLLCKILVDMGHKARGFSRQLLTYDEWDWDYIGKSDLVGITFMTLAAKEAFELTKRCKKLGRKVVMGGPHASFLPDEAMENGADFIVRREGHQTLRELIKALESGASDFSHILGLSWKDTSSKHIHNPDRPFCTQEEVENLPIPDITLISGYNKVTSIPVLTQWGCTDKCEFCSVIQMCGKMKYRPVESVLEELQRLIQIYGPGVSIFFCSDNFFAYKGQAIALLKGIIELDLDIEGGLQMRADTICNSKMEINEEILSLMWSARIRMQYLGLESPNQKTLDSYNKRLKVKQIELAVKAIVAKGFHTHGMFALGGDTDDEKVFRKLIKFCRKIGIHTVQFLNLMPLPGTPLAARLENEERVLSKEWWKYNGNFAVIIPKQMSSYSLQIGAVWASAKFYSRTWTIWLIILSLPKILWLLMRYNRLKLNTIKAVYALITKKKNILKVLTNKLPSHVQTDMKLAISLPVIRLWALNQVRKVKVQVRPHVKFLRENHE